MPHEAGAPAHQPNTPHPAEGKYALPRMTGATDFEQSLVAEVGSHMQAIEGLRSEGHRTAEAEKSYENFKSLHQGLLQKLAAQREETATKPVITKARLSFSRRRPATLAPRHHSSQL